LSFDADACSTKRAISDGGIASDVLASVNVSVYGADDEVELDTMCPEARWFVAAHDRTLRRDSTPRADQQHAGWMAGDERGVYGDYSSAGVPNRPTSTSSS